jgi:hypothetical protein
VLWIWPQFASDLDVQQIQLIGFKFEVRLKQDNKVLMSHVAAEIGEHQKFGEG